jgi:glycine cleavage system regulatory protein
MGDLGVYEKAMVVSLVMTVIGRDRPGLVDAVASLVAEHGGNWLESRMSQLGGQFAGILRVEVAAAQEQSLVNALQRLQSQGLTVVVHSAASPSPQTAPGLMALDIVGHDRPGIVRQISHALALHEVNVEELNTECVSAPMTGEVLFRAQAKLQIPAACNLEGLRRDLERIAADLIIDLAIRELKSTGQ